MTILEYNERLEQIEKDYKSAKKNLYIEYAKSVRRFGIGDIIKSSWGTIIRITSFSSSMYYHLPRPIYVGSVLKKDLTPRKDNSIDTIHDNEDIVLIKKANETHE
jgi:hypothetical protein